MKNLKTVKYVVFTALVAVSVSMAACAPERSPTSSLRTGDGGVSAISENAAPIASEVGKNCPTGSGSGSGSAGGAIVGKGSELGSLNRCRQIPGTDITARP